MIQKRTQPILAAATWLPVLACLSVSARAGAEEDAELPPPPVVLASFGETILMQSDLDEVLGDRPQTLLAARERAIEQGQDEVEVEREFKKLGKMLEKEAKRELLRRALVVESARSSGHHPDEVLIEWRVNAALRRAGGPDDLERQTGRTVEQMREELRRNDLNRRFFVDRLPHLLVPGPSEIRAYYKANRARLQKPPLVNLRVIEIPAGTDREEARYDADVLRRELQFDPTRFMTRARDLAQTEKERAQAGLVVNGETGEVIEWIPEDRLPSPVRVVVEGLQPGQVSDLIEEKNGFVLVKLVDRQSAKTVPLEEAVEDIVKGLQRMQEQEMFQDWSNYYLGEVYMADGNGRRISAESFVGE